MPRRPLRLLHASDLHLHWQQREPSVAALRGLAAAARASGAETVLMAGDIFDTADQPDDFIDTVAEELSAFAAPVVLIPGNHDIRYSEREPDALGGVGARITGRHHLITAEDGELLTLLDSTLQVWGRGMPEHTPKNDPLAGVTFEGGETWRVVVAHGELTSGGLVRSSPIDLERHGPALDGVDYLALGHHDDSSLHARGRTVVCYSGSASTVLADGRYALVELSEPEGARVTFHRWADSSRLHHEPGIAPRVRR